MIWIQWRRFPPLSSLANNSEFQEKSAVKIASSSSSSSSMTVIFVIVISVICWVFWSHFTWFTVGVRLYVAAKVWWCVIGQKSSHPLFVATVLNLLAERQWRASNYIWPLATDKREHLAYYFSHVINSLSADDRWTGLALCTLLHLTKSVSTVHAATRIFLLAVTRTTADALRATDAQARSSRSRRFFGAVNECTLSRWTIAHASADCWVWTSYWCKDPVIHYILFIARALARSFLIDIRLRAVL